ncbi:MAG: metallophosphoesterase [Bacteroidales bacterium]
MSDTHGKHRSLDIPGDIDIVVHAGDVCNDGDEYQIEDFLDWYSSLPILSKIFISGNHDLSFEFFPAAMKRKIPKNIKWINNEFVSVFDIKIGALSPMFYFSEVNLPYDLDILITHRPPYGILDNGIGCRYLREYVLALQPDVHIFGHNHKAPGLLKYKGIEFFNAS